MPYSSKDDRKNYVKEELEKWHQVGTETITVPAGTFSCAHWKKDEGVGDAWVSDKRVEPVDRFLDQTVAKWRRLRPGVRLELRRTGMHPAAISTEGSLEQAILNLLNNAADASPHAVEMECRCEAGNLRILIQDRGPGIPAELAGMLGKPFFTTKHDGGTGIGLRLAKMAVDRAGGSLKLSNRPGGGARAEVVLPLDAQVEISRSFQGGANAERFI